MYSIIKYTHVPEEAKRSFHYDHVKICCNEQITSHQQKTWELSYIITGSGTRMIGNQIGEFSKGEIVLIPPDIPHCWNFNEFDTDEDGKIENITITFSTRFLNKLAETFVELDRPIKAITNTKDAVLFSQSISSLLQEIILSMRAEDELNRLSSFIKLLGLIASPDNMQSIGKLVVIDENTSKIQNIQLYVMNNYQNEIKLDNVSKLVGLDRSSFCVFFKRMVGDTFVSYLTKYRIESSCHMMQKTKKSISEICFASGFNDIPYYNRVFKKLKGVTPTFWRERYMQEPEEK